MAKERIFNLPETKGTFQIKGIVSGTKKDTFYSEKKTKNDKLMRKVNFGIEYEKGHTVYVTLQSMENDYAYFSKREKDETTNETKNVTEKVSWADRFSFNKEGFRIMGVNCGLEKTVNEAGETVNDKKIFTEFDACLYISENLKDGDSVYVRGSIDISSFADDKNNKITSLKLKPSQISLCKSPIDFDDQKFEVVNEFKMPIVLAGIEKEVDDKGNDTKRFVLLSKVINYSTIETYGFIIDEKQEKFARNLRKLKAYSTFEVKGYISNTILSEEVEEDDSWGDVSVYNKNKGRSKTELIILAGNKETLDTELYSEASINEALKAIEKENKAKNNYGRDAEDDISDDDWGSADSFDDDEDEPW